MATFTLALVTSRVANVACALVRRESLSDGFARIAKVFVRFNPVNSMLKLHLVCHDELVP